MNNDTPVASAAPDIPKTEYDAEHVVILVPGIRDFGEWIDRIGEPLRDAGLGVTGAHVSYFGLIPFLFPFPFFRNLAIEQVWNRIETAMLAYENATRISFIAHSFGTYIVAQLLRAKFILRARRLSVYRVILCGSVLKDTFPFEQITTAFKKPIVNEVGTHDAWPVMAEALTFIYGKVGTFGFNSALVKDRFHNGFKHGDFFTEEFCRNWWLPFLMGQEPKSSPRAVKTPAYIRNIARIPWRYPLACIVLSLLALMALFYIYRPAPLSYHAPLPEEASSAAEAALGAPRLAYWRLMIEEMHDAAAAECALVWPLCDIASLPQFLLKRDFRTVVEYDSALEDIASCKAFHYPLEGGDPYDPYKAIEALRDAFPACVTLRSTEEGIWWTANRDGLRQSGSTFLCGCEAQ